MTRRGRVRAGLLAVITGAAGTLATAVPLAVLGTAAAHQPVALVAVHVAFATVLAGGIAVKLAAVGPRSILARARRFWATLVAGLGTLLAGYAALTGVLALLEPAWANQHLAAGFWTTAAIAAHARHRRTRARTLLRPD